MKSPMILLFAYRKFSESRKFKSVKCYDCLVFLHTFIFRSRFVFKIYSLDFDLKFHFCLS